MNATQSKPSIVFCHGLWADGSRGMVGREQRNSEQFRKILSQLVGRPNESCVQLDWRNK